MMLIGVVLSITGIVGVFVTSGYKIGETLLWIVFAAIVAIGLCSKVSVSDLVGLLG